MSLIDQLNHVKVLCIGDVMLDRFITGSVKRISPESPVPVLSVSKSVAVPGGAGNVARNIAALGGHCTLVSVVGDDTIGQELKHSIEAVPNVRTEFVLVPSRPTTEKVRFVAQGQHMLRTDIETSQPITAEVEKQVLARIEALLPSHDVLVLSDYAKGLLTDAVLSGAIALANAQGLPSIVDPKSALIERYAGATIITPNAKEVQEATGIDPTDDNDLAVQAGKLLLHRASLGNVLVTRAHRGMSLVSAQGEPVHISATAKEVFDVVGAGDTVVATLALSLGAKLPVVTAAQLANTAAGIVVGKRGTATVSQTELSDAVHLAGQGGLNQLQDKVVSLDVAKQLVESWRRDGFKVGFTNGCFDILHVGHLAILNFSRANCGRLIVGVNSDASVKRLKGESRPINKQDDRSLLLAGMLPVDAVVLFDEDTPLETITALQPDVLVKGADYTIDRIVGADAVLARGGQVLTCELVPGRSTSRIVSSVQATSGKGQADA
jgi:D-beta-D-heptose 7-phosphate kinase / D-beta-D-heptose 1-phosphate adenosyltransferase